MTTSKPLRLFNSLTRQLEEFKPQHPGKASVYSCGPTVYNYQHIGNMRAYVFADTLGRVLSYKGYALSHVINITDVGHLTSDADAGDDKMEKAAAAQGKTAWDIAAFYQADFEADLARLNIRKPQHPKATDYVPAMIDWATAIADKHCYELESGLYFDTSTVPEYGRLAGDDWIEPLRSFSRNIRANGADVAAVQSTIRSFVQEIRMLNADRTQKRYERVIAMFEPLGSAEQKSFHDSYPRIFEEFGRMLESGRIDPVLGKRNGTDFAIWRKTPPGETRQMEWDSPWGRGAPGWHLECSVMSQQLLGHPFDIHTGGIDHREIHHPNEIAQNQAHGNCADSGATIWMHNNFLIDRRGKMSKSSGEFLRLQTLIDRGFHPLAYRLMCLQAHYRSEMEFTWEGLQAALVRLKRMVMGVEKARVGLTGSIVEYREESPPQLQRAGGIFRKFRDSISDDLNTSEVLVAVEQASVFSHVGHIGLGDNLQLSLVSTFDSVLGLNLLTLTREDLRIRPITATITEPEIEAALAQRKAARAAKDFATSDRIRDELIAAGVEVMDGDALGWDWRISIE